MDITNFNVEELNKKLEQKELTPYDIYEAYINNIDDKDKDLGIYLSVNKTDINIDEYNKKYKIPIALKDNIAVQGLPLTASSKMLENYIAPYNASVVENLNNAGMYVLGKVNMDEFAFGISTQNSKILKTSNPLNISRVPGGSSGGSAAVVAANLAPWSLGSDTGGSVRQPASFCGVVGFKPSYGLISRYGVLPFASSFDQIGTITKTVKDTAYLMNILSVKTEEDKDPITVVLKKDYLKEIDSDIKGKKIGVVKHLINESSSLTQERINEAITKLKELGAEISEIELDFIEEVPLIYSVLAYGEGSSNFERFDGVRYGLRPESSSYEEMVINSRTEGFGVSTKERIMLGSYVLRAENIEKYYVQAAKIRRKMVDKLKEIFKSVDVLVLPTVQDVAPLKEDVHTIDTNQMDKYTSVANIAGLPAISVPTNKREDELPVGLQIMGKQFDDESVLNIANIYEKNK